MKIVKVFIKNIGEVTFKQSKKYKKLRISIAPFKGIVVTYPLNCSLSSALSFVNKKTDWIKEKEKIIKNYEHKSILKPINNVIQTKFHTIIFKKNTDADIIKVKKVDKLLTILYPGNKKIEDPGIQQIIKKEYIKILKKEAEFYLPLRVAELAKKYNLKYNKLSLRNNRSRWGSCNKSNDISLNIHLMRLPYHLIDFVILHELVHTIHKNHSPAFWNYLKGIFKNNFELYRKELKNYHAVLWE